MKTVVYTTSNCPYCHQAKEFLSQRGVKFTEYDVSLDSNAAAEMIRKSGQKGVPVITIDDQVIVGFDRPRLEHLLANAGNSQRPRFGLQIADASKIAQRHGAIPVFGAFVGGVASASPAAKAGLQKGDVITEINLRPIHNAGDLERVLSELSPGNRVSIVFLRGQGEFRSEGVL